MKEFLRNNGLSCVLFLLFALFLCGQTIAGRLEYNEEREQEGLPPVELSAYITSPHFLEATSENWESEFLQMGAYVFLTIFLFQKGSSESKIPGDQAPQDEDPRKHRNKRGVPWPVSRGGWILKLYENSLGLAFVILFLTSMAVHAASGASLYNEERVMQGEAPLSLGEYLSSARFWFESFQNWQSEFLAIGSMVVLSIFLRQRGSPESKPVAARMDQTADEE